MAPCRPEFANRISAQPSRLRGAGRRVARLLALAALSATPGHSSSVTDDLAWLDRYNVVWTSPSRHAGESMPCGGGDLGLNVWVENGELLCYLQRSGCFDENNEYLKLGRLRVRLEPNPFTGNTSFRQELKLREGHVTIAAGDRAQRTTIKVWAEVPRSIAHVEVRAASPVTVTVSYESTRTTDELLPTDQGVARFGCFSWENYPGDVIRHRDEVRHEGDAVWFFHRNRDDRLLFDYMVRQQGLERVKDQLVDTQKGRTFGGVLSGDGFVADGTTEGTLVRTGFKAWRLRSAHPATSHHLRVTTHLAQTDTLQQWRTELESRLAAGAAADHDARRETQAWWEAFWRRSRIVIDPDRPVEQHLPWQIARNYQLVRYQLGCNVRGEYPTKFNGGNFTFDPVLADRNRPYSPDWRRWGGGSFTAQNQRLLHWPMLKSGDADLLRPQFEFYRRALPTALARVRAYWGHEGCLFTEQMENFGLPIAMTWGWSEPTATKMRRGLEVPFGDPRVDGSKGYDDIVEHGEQANPAVSYHWESQLEFSYLILEAHRFFGIDLPPYLPFIRNSVRFFDAHYQARQRLRTGQPLDARGRLVIFPSTSCESYRGARNPADLIAGLWACLDGLLALDDATIPAAEKTYYRAFQRRLPDYSYGEVDGRRIILPAESWQRYQNFECPQFYPLFPFNRFALRRDDLATFRHTWATASFPKNMVQSWHQDGIFFARMGLTAEAADYNTRKLQNSPRRFPTFWGPGHDWVPDHNWGGSGMIGLQEMLMQTIGQRILLLPAWPKDWDVDFKLHAPGQTIVECSYRKGAVVRLSVTPPARQRDIELPH